MDPQQPHPTRQFPHLHNILPSHPSHVPPRTANSTPASSPSLFSPTTSKAAMSFPSQPVSEGATPAATTNSPLLHPLQSHKVRETHIATVDRDFTTGRKIINQYEVIEEIGRGQHGKVKLARNLNNGENVAIKIIPRLSKKRRLGKVSAADPQLNTKREIAILKKIRHPNVVALLEVIDDPELKKIYMILEHVERGEIVWRKKGLPHICNLERLRIEKEMKGENMSSEQEDWLRSLEHKAAIKEIKRASAKSKPSSGEYWGSEIGGYDDDGMDTRSQSMGAFDQYSHLPSNSPLAHSRATSRAPSRTQSAKSFSRADTVQSSEPESLPLPDESDLETPGPLRSNPASSSALDGTMYGAYLEDPAFRGRSPSMADSIISHMSSLDFNTHAHDSFADDYSYVPCFTIENARSIFRDVVLGLEYLHYEGVVHRDIKPANLLWTRDYRVKISDFGVSYFGRPIREGDQDDTVSESEAVDFDDDRELAKTVGTPAFFAPELCYTDLDQEPPKVSEQIDVWSLGVTLFCLIFARIPFLAEEEFSMFKKIATEEVHIPRRRLRPVDPFTDPTRTSLYKRVNNEPYRSDDDLLYEDVDEDLVDLIKRMLTKNPERRIRLREVKRHPWVVRGIDSPVGWIDDTDPSRRASGRKIQVDQTEIGSAVIPLSFMERARSTIKKLTGRVMHPRAERMDTSSRRRATSSAASSAGDSPSNAPSTPYPRDGRRKSLPREDDYFATVTQMPVEHPLAQSVTASPQDSPQNEAANAEEQHFRAISQRFAGGHARQISEFYSAGQTDGPFTPQKPLARHGHARSVTNAFLHLNPFTESRTVPTTPSVDRPLEDVKVQPRKPRGARHDNGESSRARSMDRAGLVFPNVDKRAEPIVGLVTANVPGNFQQPKSLRLKGSVDLGPNTDDSPLPSPNFFSSHAISAYQHGQVKSESNLPEKQLDVSGYDERPSTAHRTPDVLEAMTPPPRVYNVSTPESFARAQEQLYRRQIREYEVQTAKAVEQAANRSTELIDPAHVPCPPSPDDEMFHPKSQVPSRESTGLTLLSSSSASLGDMVQTPLTSPSEIANASFISAPIPVKGTTDPMLTFQSDPSLPALLSGASSVSADMEGEFLGNPGVVNRSSLIETTDSLTPPAGAKEPIAGFPLEQQELRDQQEWHNNVISVGPERPASRTVTRDEDEDEEEDSDSDGGLLMASRPKKKTAAKDHIHALAGQDSLSKRRDTNTSVGSTETAKKLTVHHD